MCSWWFVNTEETFALLLSKVSPNPPIMLREHNYNKSTVYTSVQLRVRDGTRLEALRELLIYYHMRRKSGEKKIGIKILSTLLAVRIKSWLLQTRYLEIHFLQHPTLPSEYKPPRSLSCNYYRRLPAALCWLETPKHHYPPTLKWCF